MFVVPALAEAYVTGDVTTKAAVDAAWMAQHQFGGALLGEHLGQLLVIAWTAIVSVIIVRTGALARWLGVTGLAVSAVYLLNQGDVLAIAVPSFPVFDFPGRSAVPGGNCGQCVRSRRSRCRVFARTAANVCGLLRMRDPGTVPPLQPFSCKTTRKRS